MSNLSIWIRLMCSRIENTFRPCWIENRTSASFVCGMLNRKAASLTILFRKQSSSITHSGTLSSPVMSATRQRAKQSLINLFARFTEKGFSHSLNFRTVSRLLNNSKQENSGQQSEQETPNTLFDRDGSHARRGSRVTFGKINELNH